MKILYVNTYFSPSIAGGAEITLLEQVAGVKEAGHEVVVLCTSDKKGINESVYNGIRVIRVGLRNIYWPFSRIKRKGISKFLWHFNDRSNSDMCRIFELIVDSENPDVISFHNLAGWSVKLWASPVIKKIPAVQVLHDFYTLCPNSNMFKNGTACVKQCLKCKVMRFGASSLSRNVAAVVAVSSFVEKKHINAGYFKGVEDVYSIHNVRKNNGSRFLKGFSDGPPVNFGFLGTISPIKGVEYLLKSFVQANIPGSELFIAGHGDDDYVNILKNKYDFPNIHFLGYVEPSEFLFPKIDLLVVPSLWDEPLGMIVSEAGSFGIPSLVSKRGGLIETIVADETGVAFDPNVPGDLETVMKKITGNVEFYNKLKIQVFRKFSEQNSYSTWIKKYESIYEKVSNIRK